jgi:DNA-binding transcriptional ArsR family regulator
MVEQNTDLDLIFYSLSDTTRRDILKRVSKEELSITSIASPYHMSFAAIAKHVQVLEKAKLVTKRREGKHQIISVVPKVFKKASKYLEQYEKMWNDRFSALDELLTNTN